MFEIYNDKNTCLDVRYRAIGDLATNVYIIRDGSTTIVVDPADHADFIIQALGGDKLDAIFLTHHHIDHIGAACDLRDKTGAKVYASVLDSPIIDGRQPHPNNFGSVKPCPVDFEISKEGDISIGTLKFKALFTPGHSEGSMCLFADARDYGDGEQSNVLISGDLLFCGSIGRTDFNGGDMGKMISSLEKIFQLPDNTVVLTGHNAITTIGLERDRVYRHYC